MAIDVTLAASALVQALVGSVSANVRRVVLRRERGAYRIVVWLERDDAYDRLELADVSQEFLALLPGEVGVQVLFIVGMSGFSPVGKDEIVVFGRRE